MTGAPITFPLRGPDLFPRQFVQRHHRVLGTSGRADQKVAIDQDRFTVAPLLSLFTFELSLQIDLPFLFAFGAKAEQLSGWSNHVNAILIHCRR